MTWYLSHRSTTLQRAISRALLYSLGYAVLSSSTQAATIGKTIVSSAQHKPLFASISVTDIRNTDFSIDMASALVYQQMGMTPTDSMSVNFVPTSASTGQLIISTTRPVSKPFADLVLALNDGDQRTVIPKTLLMPLDDSLPIKTSNTQAPTTIVSGAKRPTLPVISANNAKPLTLKAGLPPPLMTTSRPSLSAALTPNVQDARQQPIQTASVPIVASSSRMSGTIDVPSSQTNTVASNTVAPDTNASNIVSPANVNTVNSTQTTVNRTISSRLVDQSARNTAMANIPVVSDKTAQAIIKDKTSLIADNSGANASSNQSIAPNPIAVNSVTNAASVTLRPETLSIQVTRQIQPSSTISADQPIAVSSTLNDQSIPKRDEIASPTVDNNLADTLTAQTLDQTIEPRSTSDTKYTVQPNDNLWIISQQIAQQNNLNITTVMAQIKAQNPEAFINKNAGQLRADAQLNLSDYDVVPSQQNLQAAISEQRRSIQQLRRSNSVQKPIPKPAAKRTKAAKRQNQSATIKKLPKARFSVVAPGRNGNSDGTQTQAGAKSGNGLNTDILSTLRSTRQTTAAQARSLSDTNNTLGSYTQKIQLQNQKLAELQARLKELRGQ